MHRQAIAHLPPPLRDETIRSVFLSSLPFLIYFYPS
jgi:hypothetical protein